MQRLIDVWRLLAILHGAIAHAHDIRCHCDVNTTVGSECRSRLDDFGELVFDQNCQCKPGFDGLQPTYNDEEIVVKCAPRNTTEIRCYCDNRSSFPSDDPCLGKVGLDGRPQYLSGCNCAHSQAKPEIGQEYFYSKMFVVRCVWAEADLDLTSEYGRTTFAPAMLTVAVLLMAARTKEDGDRGQKQIIPVRKKRAASQANTTSSSSTTSTTSQNDTTTSTAKSSNTTASTTTTQATNNTTHLTTSTTTSKPTTKISSSTSNISNATITTTHTTNSTLTTTSRSVTNKTNATTVTTAFTTATMLNRTTLTTHQSSNGTTTHKLGNTTAQSTNRTMSTSSAVHSTYRFNATNTTASGSSKTSNITSAGGGITTNWTGSTTTTTDDYSSTTESEEDADTFGRCNITKFKSGTKKTAEILLYVGSFWLVLWVVFTIVVNLMYGVMGHHRLLDAFQEMCLAVIFIFMGLFTLRPDLTDFCKANKIVLHFFETCFLSVAIMKTLFLSSLVKGRSSRNGRLPVLVNYVWPPIFAAVITVLLYFGFKSHYYNNEVHCFSEIYDDLYWTYVIPAISLYMMGLFSNQMAVTACKMSRPTVDKPQLYWAKRTCKGLPIVTMWFCMCFFTLLYAADMQKIWLFGVYLGLCIVYGPMVFVFHTYCYEKTCQGLFAMTGFAFYKPCPTKKGDPNHVEKVVEKKDLRNRNPLTDPVIAKKGAPLKADVPPIPVASAPVVAPPHVVEPPAKPPMAKASSAPEGPNNPTSSQEFYNWLLNPELKNPGEAEQVLFKKTQ